MRSEHQFFLVPSLVMVVQGKNNMTFPRKSGVVEELLLHSYLQLCFKCTRVSYVVRFLL